MLLMHHMGYNLTLRLPNKACNPEFGTTCCEYVQIKKIRVSDSLDNYKREAFKIFKQQGPGYQEDIRGS